MNQKQPISPLTLKLRLGEREDLDICSQLDASYTTDYVWQMNFRERDHAVQIAFDRVRLPRMVSVEYPYTEINLQRIFEAADYFLVAIDASETPDLPDAPDTSEPKEQIAGCIVGSVEASQNSFIIYHLVVHPALRRRGVGKTLLRAGRTLALRQGCRRLTIRLQTKNHPAIALVRQAGFIYSGYDDRYYHNGDIALIYSLML